MSHFFRNGNTFRVADNNAIDLHQHLPVGNYIVKQDPFKNFFLEMIDGFKPGPIKSEDIFELYRVWCGRVGITKFAPMHVLTAKLGKRPDIKKLKGRYLSGAQEKQAAFLLPKNHFETPDGKSQTEWLTQCVMDFKETMSNYRNGGHSTM